MSSFEFSSTRVSVDTVMENEPPDKGGKIPKVLPSGNSVINGVSFRDKALGKKVVPPREKEDFVAKNKVRVEHVNGNRLTPMVHIDPKILEELSVPWKGALIVRILGKSLGFNVMKAKLASTWKIVGGFDIMDIGNGYYMARF